MAAAKEGIQKTNKEIAKLQGKRELLPLVLTGICIFLVALLVFIFSLGNSGFTYNKAKASQQKLNQYDYPAVQRFIQLDLEAQRFLSSYASAPQRILYERTSYALTGYLQDILDTVQKNEDPSIFQSFLISIFAGIQKIAFLAYAWFPIWLVVLAFAYLSAGQRTRVYSAVDLLGQTGNGRLYYSGSRFDLSSANAEGTPEFQVRGLACLAAESEIRVRESRFVQVLKHYQAHNQVTQDLSAIILKHSQVPAFTPAREDVPVFNVAYRGATLTEQSLFLLEEALLLHKRFCQGEVQLSPQRPPEQREPWTPDLYARTVGYCFLRVHTPRMRKALARLTPAQIAAAVLALQCGRIMSVSQQASNQWNRSSPFPQLGARAVLHSMPTLMNDFTAVQRTDIRQALVFASRQSLFAPVRFPQKMTAEARALRNWLEVLLAEPQDLFSDTDEVELHALCAETHELWNRIFTEQLFHAPNRIREECFINQQETIFTPIKRLLSLAREGNLLSYFARIDFLAGRVADLTKEMANEDGLPEPTGERIRFHKEKVLPPLSEFEIERLSILHKLPIEDIRAWSPLRIMLHSYGWLARRVGDSSVPENSLVFNVFSFHEIDRLEIRKLFPGIQDSARLGFAGMVPLRAAHVRARWGNKIVKAFLPVDRAWIAEHEEDYARLLEGLPTKAEEEALRVLNEGVS